MPEEIRGHLQLLGAARPLRWETSGNQKMARIYVDTALLEKNSAADATDECLKKHFDIFSTEGLRHNLERASLFLPSAALGPRQEREKFSALSKLVQAICGVEDVVCPHRIAARDSVY